MPTPPTERRADEPTWPKAVPPDSKAKKIGHAWRWGPLVAALTALITSVAGYIDAAGKQVAASQKQEQDSATNSVAGDKAYEAMRQALGTYQAASDEHAKDIQALREAVAELRGAVGILGKQKPSITGPTDRAGQALDTVQATPAPHIDTLLPAQPPVPTKAEVTAKIQAK